MSTADRLICNQNVWVRFPQCPQKNISGCWGVRSPRLVWDQENFASSNLAIPTTMKTLLKDPRLYFSLWIVLSIILATTLGACKQKPLIEKGDVVEKFVIDSMVQLPPHSTIELDRKYKYFMSDSSEFTSLRKYNIGDTITYVYKKQGK